METIEGLRHAVKNVVIDLSKGRFWLEMGRNFSL